MLNYKKFTIVSTNKNKIKEASFFLNRFSVNLQMPKNLIDVEETGTTFLENSQLKVLAHTNEDTDVVFSDDAGLIVPSMNNEPGVYSARFATKEDGQRDFNWAMQRIIDYVHKNKLPSEAFFICVVSCYIVSEKRLLSFIGRLDCQIAEKITENSLFGGYDPFLYLSEQKRTFSELSFEERMDISPRMIALQQMMNFFLN